MVLSFDHIQTALQCGQKYRFLKASTKQKSGADRPVLLSNAVHHFLFSFYATLSQTSSLADAISSGALGVRCYVQQERDKALEANVTDNNYQQVLEEVEVTSIKLATWFTELLPKYELLNKQDIIPGCELALALNWTITDEARGLTETIDGVFRDTETGQIILVDWKLKTSFVSDEAASLDGKLALQCAMLNSMGANITAVCSIQLRSTMPAEAKISKVDHQPLIGSESYNTTWAYWSRSLPMGLNPRKFEAKIRPKLKDESFFVYPVINIETPSSNKYALDNAVKAIKLIEFDLLPAVHSMNVCDQCPFLAQCGLMKYVAHTDERGYFD